MPKMVVLPPLKLIGITLILSLSGIWHYGYQITSVNPTEYILKSFLNQTYYEHYGKVLAPNDQQILWTVVLNLPNVGCLAGTIVSMYLMEKLGRKRSFFVTTSLCALGPMLCALAYNIGSWECFAVGRFITGLGSGIAMCVQPIYFTEISATEYRGSLNAITGVLVEFGYMLGSIIALPLFLGTYENWNWIFYLELCPNVLAFIMLPFLHESPKFIMAKYNDRKLAIESLVYYKHRNLDSQLMCIIKEIEVETKTLGLKDLFKKAYLRKGLILACLAQFACSFSGISVLGYFSTRFFEQTGIGVESAGYATAGMASLNLLAAIISCFIIERTGRRPLLIACFIIIAISGFVFAVFANISRTNNISWPGYICILAISFLAFFFSLGPGAIQWFVAAELTPQNARSAAITATMVFQGICFTLSVFVYGALEIAIQEWSFLLFTISVLSVAVYFWKAFPETKNKDPIEIIKMLGFKDLDQSISTDLELEQISV